MDVGRLLIIHGLAEEYGWSYDEIERTPIGLIEELSFLQSEVVRLKPHDGGTSTRKLKKALK